LRRGHFKGEALIRRLIRAAVMAECRTTLRISEWKRVLKISWRNNILLQ
jgi:hypothetical protein